MTTLLIKSLWLGLGIFSTIGGIIGLILPIIPQVPFFLFAIFCLSKFSPRFHRWIENTRLYQKFVTPLLNKITKKKVHN